MSDTQSSSRGELMRHHLRNELRNSYVSSSVSFVKDRSGSINLVDRKPSSLKSVVSSQENVFSRPEKVRFHDTSIYKSQSSDHNSGSQSGTSAEGDILSPGYHRESLKSTLRLMGESEDAYSNGRRRRAHHVPKKSSLSTTQLSLEDISEHHSVPIVHRGDKDHHLHHGDSGGQETSFFSSDTDSRNTHNHRRHIGRYIRKRKGMMGAKFRRLAKFLTILFGLWKVHAKKVQKFLEHNVDLLDVEVPVEVMFDVTEYKADKQARVSNDIKRILMKDPGERTMEEVKHVQVALGNYHSIAEYPLIMTSLMAQRAWYEKYTAKRVIVKQDHPSRCYYFILSGSVVVTKIEGESDISRTECFLSRGEAFGDLGLVTNAPRQATVISRENVELLVFGDEDYVEIFMSGGLKDPQDAFLRSLYCLKGWPIEQIAENPENAFLSYFKRGTVLVYNNKFNEWIYIVRSGSCKVLKKLKNTQPMAQKHSVKAVQQQRSKLNTNHQTILLKNLVKADKSREKRSLIYRQKALEELNLGIEVIPVGTRNWDPIEQVALVNNTGVRTNVNHRLSITGPFLTKTNMKPISALSARDTPAGRTGRHPSIPEVDVDDDVSMTINWHDQGNKPKKMYIPQRQGGVNKRTLSDELNDDYFNAQHEITDADENPLFIRVRTLTKGSTFGLADLVHNDQPTLSLVSNGAECILIKKKFYWDFVSKEMLRKLKKEVSPYPTDDELQNLLQDHVNWLCNREKLVKVIEKERRMENTNVHDARSIPDLRL